MKENQKSLLPLQVESEAIDLPSLRPLGWIQSLRKTCPELSQRGSGGQRHPRYAGKLRIGGIQDNPRR
jgi:hypothetical protein